MLIAAAALAAAPMTQSFELTSSDIQPGKLMPKAHKLGVAELEALYQR